jgi:hypothetical protein
MVSWQWLKWVYLCHSWQVLLLLLLVVLVVLTTHAGFTNAPACSCPGGCGCGTIGCVAGV